MKSTLTWVACLVSLAGLPSCSQPDASSSHQPPAASLQPTPASAGAEILTIRHRDGFVEVVSGPDGVHYNVLGPDGAAVATRLTRDELAARFPLQAQAVERGLATSRGTILDASNRPEATFDASPRQPPAASRQPPSER
jgi:hypothetical protein